MNIKRLFFLFITATILFSCGTTSFYQLYKATPVYAIETIDGSLVYEDESCKISYNMWKENGSIGFRIYNKTIENIYLNLDDSHFILNGIAYTYYQNRTITNTTGNSVTKGAVAKTVYYPLFVTAGISSSSGYSVAYTEEKVIAIPPKSAKIISEYNINELIIRNCNLLKYPSKRQVKIINFTSEDSPLIFSNRISYKVGDGATVKFENNFFVSEISNYPSSEFFEIRKEKKCDTNTSIRHFKYASPDRFYIFYNKGEDTFKY